MVKTISVDELTYSNIVTTAGKLMIMFEKPFSLGFTIYLGMQTLEEHMRNMSPETIKKCKELLKDVTSAKDFDESMENKFSQIVEKPS
jgi:hypothetical protein